MNNNNRPMIELRAIDYIPWRERHGKVWHQGPFWFSSNFVVLTMVVGFTGPLAGLGLGWTTIAVILGAITGTFFMAFHANQGPQLGVPQMIQSRAQFGSRGVVFAMIAAICIYVGFNVFDVPMATEGFRTVWKGAPNWAWYAGIVIVQATIAIVGYDMLHLVMRYLTYILVAVFAVLTAGFVSIQGGMRILTMGHFDPVAFLTQFAAVAGYMIAYAVYVSDYTRYLPAKTRLKPLVLWTYAGTVISAAWLMPLGALFVIELKDGATVTSIFTAGNMILPGFGSVVMVLCSIALVAVMAVNTYGATLVALAAMDSFWPIRSSVRARVLGCILLSIPCLIVPLVLPQRFEATFSNFLAIILYFLVPWSAINLVDFYWIRRGKYSVLEIFSPDGMYGQWAWRGLVAYAAGFVAMTPFFVLPFYVGPVAQALGRVDVSIIFGLSVSGLVYYFLARNLNLDREEAAYRQSLATLEPEAAAAH